MIASDVTLTPILLRLDQIQINQYEERDIDRMLFFADLLKKHPGMYAGIWHVEPSKTHKNMYSLLEGHRRYCASIMTGRCDALCIVIESPKKSDRDMGAK